MTTRNMIPSQPTAGVPLAVGCILWAGVMLVNLACWAGAVWVAVKVLQWTGVL